MAEGFQAVARRTATTMDLNGPIQKQWAKCIAQWTWTPVHRQIGGADEAPRLSQP